jgi:hypothetical protein
MPKSLQGTYNPHIAVLEKIEDLIKIIEQKAEAGEIKRDSAMAGDRGQITNIIEDFQVFAKRDLQAEKDGAGNLHIKDRITGVSPEMYLQRWLDARPNLAPRAISDDAYEAFILCNVTAMGRLQQELGADGFALEARRWQFDLRNMRKPGVVPSGKDERSKTVRRDMDNPWSWSDNEEGRLDAIAAAIRLYGTAKCLKLAAAAGKAISGQDLRPTRLAG